MCTEQPPEPHTVLLQRWSSCRSPPTRSPPTPGGIHLEAAPFNSSNPQLFASYILNVSLCKINISGWGGEGGGREVARTIAARPDSVVALRGKRTQVLAPRRGGGGAVAVTRLSAPVPVSPRTHTGRASLSSLSQAPCLVSN